MLKIVMMSESNNESDYDEFDDDVLVETELARPSLYALIMHNDDYTTMEFVVQVLVDVLGLDLGEAYLLMTTIHKTGKAKVAELPKEIAETKVSAIEKMAMSEGYPLLTTLEKVE